MSINPLHLPLSTSGPAISQVHPIKTMLCLSNSMSIAYSVYSFQCVINGTYYIVPVLLSGGDGKT